MTENDTPAPEAQEDEIEAEAEILSVFDIYDTDRAAEENGKWFNNLRPGINMCLRRATSRTAMKVRQRIITKYRKFSRNGEFPAAIQEKIQIEIMAEGIITDWSGAAMRMPDGSPLPYSKQNAVLLLTKAPALRDELTAVATDMDNYRREQAEDALGNS